MNGMLLELVRHNAWATRELISFCKNLDETQLNASTTGTFGDILTTFNHVVRSDAHYLRRLSEIAPEWLERDEPVGLDELDARTIESLSNWERYLSEEVDSERLFQVDNGALDVRAGVVFAQGIHHGNIHREQICSILTSLGLQPPETQPWEYALATERMWATGSTPQTT